MDLELEKEFKIIIKKKYSKNIYIQYDSLYSYHNMGKTSEESRLMFEKFANKVFEGQIYIVLPESSGITMLMSEKGALCVGFDNDSSIKGENYLQLLEEQCALGYIIEFKHEFILNGIQKDLLKNISDYCYQEYVKIMEEEPENIYIKLSSEGGKNIITNHQPDEDVMMYFYKIDYEKKNITKKMDELKEILLKENPEINLDFDFNIQIQTENKKKDFEEYFEKVDNENHEDENENEENHEEFVDEINDEENINEDNEENKYYENLFKELYKEDEDDYFMIEVENN